MPNTWSKNGVIYSVVKLLTYQTTFLLLPTTHSQQEQEREQERRTEETCKLLDCSGVCILTPTLNHCTISSLGYETCSSFVGDGICHSASPTYQSDTGIGINFNCARFKCDGGDCEVCGSDEIGDSGGTVEIMDPCRDFSLRRGDGQPTTCEEMVTGSNISCEDHFCDNCEFAGYCDRYCGLCSAGYEDHAEICQSLPQKQEKESHDGACILLTMSIPTHQLMTNSKRNSPRLRLREYKRTLQKYVKMKRDVGSGVPIVVVENTGGNLSELREVVADEDGFEFVSFVEGGLRGREALGKGWAEGRAIQYAIGHSRLLNSCEFIIKITGKYFIPAILDIAENTDPKNTQLIVQSTPNFWSMWDDEKGNSGIVRTEVVGFQKEIAEWLFQGQDESKGEPMERIVKIRSQEITQGLQYFPLLHLLEPVKNAEGINIENL